MPAVTPRFRPAWWLRNAHLQTLWPFLFRPPPPAVTERERLETPDGDFLDLSWHGDERAPLVLLLHGLEGGLDSNYIRRSLHGLLGAGYRACLLQFRGCSGEPNRLARSYHSGDTGDLDFVLAQLRARGEAPFALLGFSLGGNVLLKWLGETGASAGLRCAMAVSVPFELDHAARRMAGGASRLYQRYLLGSLHRKSREKFHRHGATTRIPLRRLDTFRLFDDQVTAPLHGFDGVDDYYERSSSRQYIPAIRIPTLILHASDDPFMYPRSAPTPAELPDSVQLELSDHGGHVGFITGNAPWRARCWYVERLLDWLADFAEAAT